MPQIYLCFLWHMHQPFYKDMISGEYKLPWTRLHALKDYYGMARILDEFPQVRQTFNLVPSMMVQVAEYAVGKACDPFLEVALKPSESLSEAERLFLLQNAFHVYAPRMIYRYPRYGELYEGWQAHKGLEHAARAFGVQELRDLQVLSQLCWFDEEFLASDPEVKQLVAKGRNFSLEDQALIGQKETQILAMVLPVYKRLCSAGQIEISTTPFYHPILPLLCDSDIAAVAHPNVPLPRRFRYPQDARTQLEMARQFIADQFGAAPAGLWPSEGSVSDEVFQIAADSGFTWAATDSGVLSRTLGKAAGVELIYRPYCWRQGQREMRVVFRDHFLSDLIGFVYSRANPAGAAADFLGRIRENSRPILASGRDVLVPIILDGENAWEYYEQNGRPFLRELYRRISQDPQMTTVPMGEAFERIEPDLLDHIFPGSWINANFDVWIGAEEDNQAWEQLLRARQAYDQAKNVSDQSRRMAYEELLIAEGSDWCWWYGPEHESANRVDFDQLYRSHLANVYRFLGLPPAEELSRPILKMRVRELHLEPTGQIRPVVDGKVSSYFEWLGAGVYRVDSRAGAMHGKRFLIREIYYGSNGTDLYFRVDFQAGFAELLPGVSARLRLQGAAGWDRSAMIELNREGAHAIEGDVSAAAFESILEMCFALSGLSAGSGRVRFQFSLWKDGLPVDAVPQQGWLEIPVTAPEE